tara:strand:- start:849 stop:1031 length:183 start_codon:yes stop_codon:yes gene_type:complete
MLNVIRAALGVAFVGIVVLMFSSCVFVAWKPVQTFTSPEEEVSEEETLPPLTPFDLISEE